MTALDFARRGSSAARRFARLSPGDRSKLLHAVAMTAAVELGLRTLRLPTLARALGVGLIQDRQEQETPGAALATNHDSVVRAVDSIFSRMPPSGRCLRRSLVLAGLLRAFGPKLKFGVARRPDGIAAHAWVEINGVPLPEMRGSIAGFTALR